MSDYLASIVARNLEIGDRLQPRPISKFEPVVAGPRAADGQISSPDQLEEHVFVDADASIERDGAAPRVRESGASTSVDQAPLHHTEPPSPPRDVTSRGAARQAAAHPPHLGRQAPTAPAEPAASAPPTLEAKPSAQSSHPTSGAQPRPPEAPTASPFASDAEEKRSPLSPIVESSPKRRKAGERQTDVPVSIDVSSVRTVVQRRALSSTSVAPVEGQSVAYPRQGVTDAPSRAHDVAGQPDLKAAITGALPASAALATPKPRRTEPRLTADRAGVTDRTPPGVEALRPILPLEVRIRPESTPADPLAPHVMAAPEPSTIHVTIGRIEVRATPETSRKRVAAASTVPSLDDYLRRRAEGSGR
jgi:hypothetical protein